MTNHDIMSIDAWEALDSRGTPTVACKVTLRDGSCGQASVPSGASTGSHEAHELRDGELRHDGKGVRNAVSHVVGELADAVMGLDATSQRLIDDTLRMADGTLSLHRLGANAILAISLSSAIAASQSLHQPLWSLWRQRPLLPLPMVNIFSGGAHAGGLIDIQDVLVVPVGAESFSQAIEWCARVRRATEVIAVSEGYSVGLVADEGGVAGPLASNRQALELVVRGIEQSGLSAGTDMSLALDLAANQLLDINGRYTLNVENRQLDSNQLIDIVRMWTRDFPIVSIEDLLAEDDWAGWQLARSLFPDIQVLGDDLFATNENRLRQGIDAKVANAVLIKVNQNGTLTGAHDVLSLAHSSGFNTVVSARSGETEDSWLADLAVGWRAGQIKVGSTTRSERTSKWNRLLQIEHEFRGEAEYAGGLAVSPQCF